MTMEMTLWTLVNLVKTIGEGWTGCVEGVGSVVIDFTQALPTPTHTNSLHTRTHTTTQITRLPPTALHVVVRGVRRDSVGLGSERDPLSRRGWQPLRCLRVYIACTSHTVTKETSIMIWPSSTSIMPTSSHIIASESNARDAASTVART